MREETQAAIDMLYGLKRGVYRAEFGICSNLEELQAAGAVSYATRRRIKAMMRRWPEYSGEPNYPVPGIAAYDMCPEITYDDIRLGEYWSGEYGGNRIRLVNFLIRELEQELQDAQ